MIAQTPASRRAALRRSDLPDALFATDLPLLAQEDDLSAMIAVEVQQGWRVGFLPNGWMTLDHDVPVPEAAVPPMPRGEMGCCLSLLLRHPGGEKDARLIRALAKADEVGAAEVEKLCRGLHRELAQRLRQHVPLPDLLPNLCAAIGHHGINKGGKDL